MSVSAGTCLWTASSSAEPLRALRLRTMKKPASPARAPMSASATSPIMSPPHQGMPALELPCCEYGAAQAEANPLPLLAEEQRAGRTKTRGFCSQSHQLSNTQGSRQALQALVLQAGGTRVLRPPEEALPAAATPGAGASPGAPG